MANCCVDELGVAGRCGSNRWIYHLVNKQVILAELSLSFHVLNVKTDHWQGMCALCVHHGGLDEQCLPSDS